MISESQMMPLLAGYSNQMKAFQDCRDALLMYKDLKPFRKNFIFNDGTSRELVCLEGTIPIKYRNNTYNIPIAVWLLETHPYHAPMVFVQPTQTMNIKPGSHVDRNGRVSVPYLTDWRQNTSELSGLLQVLVFIFGESPPVFAKSSRSQQPPAQTNPPYPAYPPPSYHQGQSSQGGMPQPPVYPSSGSYPGSQGYSSTPYPPSSLPYPSQGYSQATTGGGNPPYPAANSSGGNLPYPSATSGGMPSHPAPSTNVFNPYPSPRNPPAQSYGQGAGFSYPTASTSSFPHSTNAQTYTNPAAATGTSSSSSNGPTDVSRGSLTADEIKRSLLSAVEDKLRQRIREANSTHNAEMSVLRKTQNDLQAGQAKLESWEKALDLELGECGSSITVLQDKITEMKELLEKREESNELPAEDTIDTTAPLYKQLLTAFAEEQAIDDAIYLLGEALRNETIGLEVYLKKVRFLSRQQFMQKALIQKCREKASLSDIYG